MTELEHRIDVFFEGDFKLSKDKIIEVLKDLYENMQQVVDQDDLNNRTEDVRVLLNQFIEKQVVN